MRFDQPIVKWLPETTPYAIHSKDRRMKRNSKFLKTFLYGIIEDRKAGR